MSADIFINENVPSEIFHATDDDVSNLDGQLSDGPIDIRQRLSNDYNQLDEPILDTLMRDLTGIYNKMKIIALPLSSYDIYKIVLRGWDLWGPLILCTFLAFELHHSDHQEAGKLHTGPQFSDVFVLVWFGSSIVSLNYRLLSASSIYSGQISKQQQSRSSQVDGAQGDQSAREEAHQTLVSPPSLFQLICVFGYCLVAPCFGLIVLKLFSFQRLFFERILIGLIFGFAWPTFCAIRILARYQHPSKRMLAIYPIGLYYFVLSCMIILSH